MSFLDRYEQQLIQASATLQAAQPITPAPVARRRGRRLTRRGFAIGVVLIAVAAPAAALVQPWDPILGRGGQDTITSSSAAIDRSALAAYALLRRPQTERDRRLAEPLLRRLGRPLDQVQLAAVRAIQPGLAVVAVNTIDVPGGSGADGPQICVLRAEVIGCNPVARAIANGVLTLSASKDSTRYEGLVPDGVKRVRFTVASSGATTTADVVDNYVRLTIPQIGAATTVTVPNPDGSPAGRTMPGPPTPVPGTLTWLDDANRVVGPRDSR